MKTGYCQVKSLVRTILEMKYRDLEKELKKKKIPGGKPVALAVACKSAD